MHAMRFGRKLREGFARHAKHKEVDCINKLIAAIKSIPSDIQSGASSAEDACRRMKHCLPKEMPFKLMWQILEITQSLIEEEKEDGKG